MIPAILTCLFVVWLYHSLNATVDDFGTAAPPATPDGAPSIESLTQRLAALEARLERLAGTRGAKEGQR